MIEEYRPDGKEIPLNEFVERILNGTITGAVGSLKGISSQLGKGSLIAGQILGCDAKSAGKIAERVDSFLYIGDGEFHPIAIALETKKPVYKYNPKAIIDIATLTGATMVILGSVGTPIMGNDKKLLGKIKEASKKLANNEKFLTLNK